MRIFDLDTLPDDLASLPEINASIPSLSIEAYPVKLENMLEWQRFCLGFDVDSLGINITSTYNPDVVAMARASEPSRTTTTSAPPSPGGTAPRESASAYRSGLSGDGIIPGILYASSWVHNYNFAKPPVNTIVVHCTVNGINARISSIINYMKNHSDKLGYHFIIARDGTIVQAAPYTKAVSHAGRSTGPKGSHLNSYSIGISFVNLNDGNDPYTPNQEKAIRWLIGELKARLPLEYVAGHKDVAPGRKSDPRGYDLASLARDTGLQYWRSSR